MLGTFMATISSCAESCHRGGPDPSEQTRAHLAERRSHERSLAPRIVLSSKRPFTRFIALSNGITRTDLRRTADGFKRRTRE
jgi:hypothetical protein